MSGSLGSLGDSIGLTIMSVYFFAVIQLPVMFLITLNFPTVKSDFYSTAVKLVYDQHTNTTCVDLKDPTQLHYIHSVSVSIIFLGVSCLCTVFTIATVYLKDKGIENGGSLRRNIGEEDYTTSNPDLVTHPTITFWNNLFLGVVVLGHTLLVCVVASPTSIHLLLLVCLLIYVSMSGILQPKIQSTHSSNAASYVSSMYMGWVLMYSVAMMYMANNIPYDPSSVRLQFVALAAFLDCFLLIFGHTWDSTPSMQTIMNCRLLYVVSWLSVNMVMYILWGPFMAIPFLHQ